METVTISRQEYEQLQQAAQHSSQKAEAAVLHKITALLSDQEFVQKLKLLLQLVEAQSTDWHTEDDTSDLREAATANIKEWEDEENEVWNVGVIEQPAPPTAKVNPLDFKGIISDMEIDVEAEIKNMRLGWERGF